MTHICKILWISITTYSTVSRSVSIIFWTFLTSLVRSIKSHMSHEACIHKYILSVYIRVHICIDVSSCINIYVCTHRSTDTGVYPGLLWDKEMKDCVILATCSSCQGPEGQCVLVPTSKYNQSAAAQIDPWKKKAEVCLSMFCLYCPSANRKVWGLSVRVRAIVTIFMNPKEPREA